MKLRGHWQTSGRFRWFVPDTREEKTPEPLRAHDVLPRPKKDRGPYTRRPEVEHEPGRKEFNHFLADHRRMLWKRERGIYDRPGLTDYAFKLLRAKQLADADDHELTEVERICLAASVLADQRLRLFADKFTDYRLTR